MFRLANSRALFSCNANRLIRGLQKQSKKPDNKQLISYLAHSVFMGKSQTSSCHIYLGIPRSIPQRLSLRFSCKDHTLGK